MTDKIPQDILEAYSKLNEKYEVFLVGGCVRNLLMNYPVKDWDMTTNATPEEIQLVFPDGFYNNTFGTVGVPRSDGSVIEITTYRTESGFTNKRHPDKVEWGKTIDEDLSRRDFTMNAIAFNVSNSKYTDPFDGKTDINNRLIRAVGNPKERFKEDALRIMRAIRFAAQLDFDIEETTGKELKKMPS